MNSVYYYLKQFIQNNRKTWKNGMFSYQFMSFLCFCWSINNKNEQMCGHNSVLEKHFTRQCLSLYGKRINTNEISSINQCWLSFFIYGQFFLCSPFISEDFSSVFHYLLLSTKKGKTFFFATFTAFKHVVILVYCGHISDSIFIPTHSKLVSPQKPSKHFFSSKTNDHYKSSDKSRI